MAVVSECMIGNTRIKVCDDYYRDKTPKDIQRILHNIEQIAVQALMAKAQRENDDE